MTTRNDTDQEWTKEERLARAKAEQQRTRNIIKGIMAKIDAGNTTELTEDDIKEMSKTHVDS